MNRFGVDSTSKIFRFISSRSGRDSGCALSTARGQFKGICPETILADCGKQQRRKNLLSIAALHSGCFLGWTRFVGVFSSLKTGLAIPLVCAFVRVEAHYYCGIACVVFVCNARHHIVNIHMHMHTF